MRSSSYRPDIDGLRTIAVLPVVFFHAGFGLTGGYVGVDVFFVISGYLITSLLIGEVETGRLSILNFYERRARRIFPALFAMIFVTAVVSYFVMIPGDFEDFGKSVGATTAFLANVWFYFQVDYFTEAAELKPLLHTWSLGVEEQYYVVFPLAIWLFWRLFRPGWVFTVLLGLALLSFAASLWALARSPEAAFYLPQYRAWELLIGSLLALAVSRGWLRGGARHPRLASAVALLGLGAILTAVVLYGPETRFPGLAAAVPCLGAAAIIATGGIAQTPVAALLSLRPMVFIGKLSYSLYLWHWPPISFFFYTTGGLTPVQGVICVLCALVLSYLSWRFVEQPFRDRSRVSVRTIFAGSVAGMAGLFAIALLLAVQDGLPGRTSPALLAFEQERGLLHDRRDCHFVTPERAAAGDVCVRGAVGVTPSVILVGDSHSDAFSPAFFAGAEALGVAGYQYTNAGFRPLPGVTRRGNPEWAAQTEALIAFLQARPYVTTIYVAAYWLHQMTGYTYRHHGEIWMDDGYDGSGSAYNATATLNGLRRLADTFPDRRIVLLGDVPSGYELYIKRYLRENFWRQGSDPQLPKANKGLPRAASDSQQQVYDPLFRDLAEAQPNIVYDPVFDGLCGPELCPLFDGETLLFRDGDHLSHAGALRLAPRAEALLVETARVLR